MATTRNDKRSDWKRGQSCPYEALVLGAPYCPNTPAHPTEQPENPVNPGNADAPSVLLLLENTDRR